ncbi:MAG: HAMP domain-containing protein [Firmicutes bacterium]|nr:HAMP domain-containing protein [Bacillota bacterium]
MLVLAVLIVSVIIQSEQIKSFVYNQQAQYYIYEAEEVSTILKNESSPEIINERLLILAKFLNGTILTVDKEGNVTRVAQRPSERGHKHLMPKKEFMSKLKDGEKVIYTGKIKNYPADIFLAAVPVKENNNFTGAVVIYGPLTSLQKQIESIRKIASLGALLGMVLATILSVFVLKKLTKPLVKMEEVAHAIAGGDFGKQVPVISGDEVGRLASSLNNMSQQLKEKIEDIERLDNVRQEFVSNVSHELRTPLTVIQSFSEAIIDGKVKTETDKEFYLKNILEESKRLKRLVDELLDLKALEAEDVIEDMEFVRIAKLVKVTSGNFETLFHEKNIKLIVKPCEKEITVWGNVDRLKQVMTNLIGNALNHTQSGGMVEISWGEIEDKRVYINVKDNGPGIPHEELEHIWERFYKVDKSRTRTGEGTGMGLTIVKRIAELHGGTVTAESTPGEGSVFTVALPASDEN